MGGGASKSEEKKENDQKQAQKYTAEEWEQKHNQLEGEKKKKEDEVKRLQQELEEFKAREQKRRDEEAAAAAALTSASKGPGEGTPTFQVVVTAAMVEDLLKIEGVSLTQVQGNGCPYTKTQDNVVMVSAPTNKIDQVITCVTSTETLKKIPKPVPEPPKVLDKEQEKAMEAEKEAEEKKEDEVKEDPKKVPDSDVDCATDIDFGSTWDGGVPLIFTWVFEPSPYSEYDDPSGSNWWPTSHVRKAPFIRPSKVQLEIRQGMMGEWTSHDAVIHDDKAVVQYLLKPEEVSGSAYRGFQSRWVIDGEKYLSPLQLAPTLQSKLMTYPIVRNAIKALPKDKQTLANIPNENVRKACMAIENIIPMNTWDYSYGITIMPGAYLDNEVTLTLPQKIEMIAKAKKDDPAVQSEMRKTLLKSPIMVANAGAGSVGIKLDIVVKNMDFFLPKLTDPDFEALAAVEEVPEDWEALRREMQIDINELYPQYQQGVRVTFPPARTLRNAMVCKRPVAEKIKYPVDFSWEAKKDTDFFAKQKVEVVLWPFDGDYENDKQVVELTAEEKTEEFGMITKETKQTWRVYKCTIGLEDGTYKYYWLYNGKPYFNKGAPMGDQFKPPQCYHSFFCEGRVQFGIGVQV